MPIVKSELERRGRFVVCKQPWDAQGPYGGTLLLPHNRRYTLRLRPHPAGEALFWYEGFARAVDPGDYARDQMLTRYPARPLVAPAVWDLWPCQLKLSPLPEGKRKAGSPDLIGEIWLSDPEARPGGEVFRLFADYRSHREIAFSGAVFAWAQVGPGARGQTLNSSAALL